MQTQAGLLIPVQGQISARSCWRQISAAVGRGADPAPGLKKSPLGGWQVEKQNTGRVLQGGEKK